MSSESHPVIGSIAKSSWLRSLVVGVEPPFPSASWICSLEVRRNGPLRNKKPWRKTHCLAQIGYSLIWAYRGLRMAKRGGLQNVIFVFRKLTILDTKIGGYFRVWNCWQEVNNWSRGPGSRAPGLCRVRIGGGGQHLSKTWKCSCNIWGQNLQLWDPVSRKSQEKQKRVNKCNPWRSSFVPRPSVSWCRFMERKSSMWKEEASSLARKGHGLQSVLVSNDILLGHLQVQEMGSF